MYYPNFESNERRPGASKRSLPKGYFISSGQMFHFLKFFFYILIIIIFIIIIFNFF